MKKSRLFSSSRLCVGNIKAQSNQGLRLFNDRHGTVGRSARSRAGLIVMIGVVSQASICEARIPSTPPRMGVSASSSRLSSNDFNSLSEHFPPGQSRNARQSLGETYDRYGTIRDGRGRIVGDYNGGGTLRDGRGNIEQQFDTAGRISAGNGALLATYHGQNFRDARGGAIGRLGTDGTVYGARGEILGSVPPGNSIAAYRLLTQNR